MNFKKVSALACAMTIVGGMATSVPVFANTIEQGTTPVTYDNREVLPDGNGEYGMIIPTAITFDDKNMTSNADISITGIKGWDLEDWKELSVQATVQSLNEYKLELNGNDPTNYATYKLTYGDNVFQADGTEQQITQKLGIGGTPNENMEKVTGTADLLDKANAKVKGAYEDQLTYRFTELKNTKK